MGLFDRWRKSDESNAAIRRDNASVWGPIQERRQEWSPEMFRHVLDRSQIMRGDSIAQMIAGDLVSRDVSMLVCKKPIHREQRINDERGDWLSSLVGVALIDACVSKCNVTFGPQWIERVEPFLTSYACKRLPYFMSLYSDRQKFGQEQAQTLAVSVRDRMAGMDLKGALYHMTLIMDCAWLSQKLYPGCDESESREMAEVFVAQAKTSAAAFCDCVKKCVM